MNTCDYESNCLNYPGCCYKCFSQEFLKVPEDKERQRRSRKERTSNNKKIPTWKNKEGMVARKLSAIPSAYEMESRINPGSGNQMHRPGDVLDDVLHIENKERQAHFTAKGQKQITIKLDWLNGCIAEATGIGKFPAVTFSTVGSDRIYALMDFNDLASMAHEIKYLRTELYKARNNKNSTKERVNDEKGN